jgi:hypothetical protein
VSETFRPTICIDFDGCINPYSRGWQNGELYETSVVTNFFEWATEAAKHFKLVVYSSRSKDPTERQAMFDWMQHRFEEWRRPASGSLQLFCETFSFTDRKPPAWITIDDRCIRFDGNWSALELQPNAIKAFKPWMQR